MGAPERGRLRPSGGYRPNELTAAAVALLLPLLFDPSFKYVAWAPRYVTMPLIFALGIILAPRLLSGPMRRPALLALAFLAWAGVATLTAPDMTVAFWGRYSLGTGWLFMGALVAAWMLGASVRPGAAALVERGIWVACVANASIALLQQVVDLSGLSLGLYGGRSAGLYGNPVYLAELLAGGLWLALCRQRRWSFGNVAGLLIITAALAVSGSRWALGVALLAAGASMIHLGWRRGGAATLLVLAGLAFGSGLASAGISGGGTTGIDRAGAAPASGIRPRLDTWRSALPAIGARPVLGWGPNGFLAATSLHRTLAIARAEGPDTLFGDAHNVVVEIAVATGLPGLALFLGWLVLGFGAVRRVDLDPDVSIALAGFTVASMTMMLVEPLHVGVTPVALLALGAAAAAGRDSAGGPRRTSPAVGRAAAGMLCAAGLATMIVLAVGLIDLRHAELADDPAAARSAARLLPRWAEPASVVARMTSFHAIVDRDQAARTESLLWYRAAAGRDSQDPTPWNEWGGALTLAGDEQAAAAAYKHALARNPWSLQALRGAARAATSAGQLDQAAQLQARVSQLTRSGR